MVPQLRYSPNTAQEHERIGSPRSVRRARMPTEGLREALEVAPLGCSGGEGYRSLDNVGFCLGSLGIEALIRAVGTPMLRERAAWQHTALTRL